MKLLFTCLCTIFIFSNTALAQQVKTSGTTISGTIKDAGGNPLPYASVALEGTNYQTTSNNDGTFLLNNIPEGNYILKVDYLSYKTYSRSLELTGSTQKAITVMLVENESELENVVIYGNLTRGQAKALNEQKNAVNIRNVVDYEQFSRFPDQNAAEALQRIPGISIKRDQGEGEFVQIRGLPPQYNAIQLNGQRVPSPDKDDGRGVGMGMLQADLMQSIVVSKTLTPDMDGDAIGGNVNFKLKEAPDTSTLSISLTGGYNQQESVYNEWGKDIERFTVVMGKRFFSNKLGLLATGSYYNTNRGSILNQYVYRNETTDTLEQKRWNDYDVNRKRYGFIISPDFRFDDRNKVRLIYNMNHYRDDEIRRRVDFNVPEDTGDRNETRQTRNRIEKTNTDLFQLEGSHDLNAMDIDYNLSYITGNMDEPDASTYRFRRDYGYNDFSNDQIRDFTGKTVFNDPNPLVLDDVSVTDEKTRDEDMAAKLNIRIPVSRDKNSSYIGIGGKFLDKKRSYVIDAREGIINENAPEASIGEGNFGLVNIKSTEGLAAVEGYEPDSSVYNANYDAHEKITAAYILGNLQFSSRFTAIAGARYEYTTNKYFHPASNRRSKTSYGNILPSLNMVYHPAKNQNIKLAYGMGMARPDYSSLVPYYIVDPSDPFISEGNPDLKPTKSQSFDIIYERYTGNLGLVSVGFFAKFLRDEVANSRRETTIDNQVYTITKPINLGKSSVFGAEVAFNHKFSKSNLNFIRWLGIYGNYNFNFSETDYDGRKLQLTNSPKHVANLALMYDNPKNGLSFTITNVYRSELLAEVGESRYTDFYFGSEYHLDLSVSKKIGKQFTVFAQANNLTNQIEYQNLGKQSDSFKRVQQTEIYGSSYYLGLIWKL